MIKYLLLFIFLVVSFVLAFYGFMCKMFDKTNDVTLHEKKVLQAKISKNKEIQHIISLGTCENMANELKLSIIKVNSDVLGKKESCLRESKDDRYLGEIDIPDDPQISENAKNFRCFHEIAHYIVDVGKGHKVAREYGKDRTGETKSHKEQIINFYAAAIAIPQEKLLIDLETFKNSQEDEVDFLERMTQKYRQPKEMVSRRISEVKYINSIS